MSASLNAGLADLGARRLKLATAITGYADWLDHQHGIDRARSVRLGELAASLREDRLVIAFVAEFSRGKSELINALFFAGYGRRLLPAEAGRTTMCPVEIGYTPHEPPGVALLPIATRAREGTLASLRHRPVEWVRMGFDPEDADDIARALAALTETRSVPAEEADGLGLAPEGETAGMVEIPAWRYARVNLPHPLLEAGLVVLDTPGLNALGSEPELTLSVLPQAHAVFFLLAADTGVTRSDLELWRRHVHRHLHLHVAVLNKIDTLWDALRPEAEIRAAIARQRADSARLLKLPVERVYAVSAQKALVGQITGDARLVDASGIVALERFIHEEVLPTRQALLQDAVSREVGQLIDQSSEMLAQRIRRTGEDYLTLSRLAGKSRNLIARAYARWEDERAAYSACLADFQTTRAALEAAAGQIDEALAPGQIEALLESARQSLEASWTTRGLTAGMRSLASALDARLAAAESAASEALGLLDTAYVRFVNEHGLPPLDAPRLDLAAHRQRLDLLLEASVAFCRDPANLLAEKRFVIRRFYGGLVEEARRVLERARTDALRWQRIALDPVHVRLRAHRHDLEARLTHLRTVRDEEAHLAQRMQSLKEEMTRLREARGALARLAAELAV